MRYLVLFSLFISFSSFACPDISGEYLCKRASVTSPRLIEETENGFIVTRDGNSTEYIADGITVQTVPSNDSMTDGSFTSLCKGDQFIVDFKATLLYEGAVVGKQVNRTTYEFKNNELQIITKVKIKGVPLPTIKEICRLQ